MKKVYRQINAFVMRNINLSQKYLGWEFVFLFYHIVGALAIGFLAMSMSGDFNHTLLFLTIGSFMWVYLSSIFHEIGNQISYERWEGTLEYTFMAPVRRIYHHIGNSLYAVVYGIIKTAIVLIAVVLFFGLDMSGANLLSALLILIVAAVSFVGLGMIASIIPLMNPERGDEALHIVEALLMLFSGIYYEIDVLPLWMQAVAKFSPATYALSGMRDAILYGKSAADLFYPYILPLFVMGILFIPLGVFIFGIAEKRAKKLGILKRHG